MGPMRLFMRLLPVAALLGGLLSVPASQAEPNAARQPCTVNGTSADDTLDGTALDDVICARAGDDVVNARDGNDEVRGGPGNDTIVAGAGSDLVIADTTSVAGNDLIRTDDGVAGNDAVFCRDGFDVAVIDDGDFTNGCEQVIIVP